MNWSKVIQNIKNSGMSAEQIADVVKLNKATINRIQSGYISKVDYDVGVMLLSLQSAAKMHKRRQDD